MQGKEAPSQYKGSDLNIEEIKLVPAASAATVVDWIVLCLFAHKENEWWSRIAEKKIFSSDSFHSFSHQRRKC
jgi:hypothetical protein